MVNLNLAVSNFLSRLFMQIDSKMARKFNSGRESYEVKAELHSIRFCFLKKYAFFRPHFYKSISALSRLFLIKILLQKRYFKTELCCTTSQKKCFRKTFVQYVTV